MNEDVRTACPYCGVGCGLIARPGEDGKPTIEGDPDHPANFGRVCSKGAALGETLGLEGRLLHPLVDGRRVDWETALSHVAKGFSRIIRDHGPDAVAFYVSGQCLTEDYYVANKLMKGFIGSANIDTNSRLCMASSVAGHQRAFGSDTVPGNYQDLDKAELVIFAGSNAAWCHPVLYQRISAAKARNRGMKIVVIDPRRTATCDGADLHLALKPGTDTVLFNGLFLHLYRQGRTNHRFVDQHTEGLRAALAMAENQMPDQDQVAAICGLDPADVRRFYGWFAGKKKTVTLYSQGINQSTSGTDKVNAILNCHLLTGRIGRPGMGPFSLTGQPNAMGGREVGGLANQLAAHMDIDNPRHRRLVQGFWDSPTMAEKPGLKAVDLFRAIGDGRVKALWVVSTNPVVSLPDAKAAMAALKACELVVVSDCMRHTDTTAYADVLLPALTWGEKEGTVTNSERRISRQRAFLPQPGEARPDWWMFSEVAQRMGFCEEFCYGSAAEIFREHAQLSGHENDGRRDFDISALAELDDAAYAAMAPVQWPVTPQHPKGTERLFADGAFFTDTGKARFVAVVPRRPANTPIDDFPLILNTGRVRDHWHTMTRTGTSPGLAAHMKEPLVDIHPDDAASFGIADGELVVISSRWGELVARARLDDGQQRGCLFAPIHWNGQFASHGRVGEAVNPALDPVSGQPEFKHTPVRLVPFAPKWQAFAVSRRPLETGDAEYWCRAAGKGCWHYELAGHLIPDNWDSWAKTILGGKKDGEDWIAYRDSGSTSFRYALLRAGRLEGCVFVALDRKGSTGEWLAGLFQDDRLSDQARAGLLAGRPPAGVVEAGPIVCTCFNVGWNQITAAIENNGLDSVEDIGAALHAGTNCGSCKPELNGILHKVQVQPRLASLGSEMNPWPRSILFEPGK